MPLYFNEYVTCFLDAFFLWKQNREPQPYMKRTTFAQTVRKILKRQQADEASSLWFFKICKRRDQFWSGETGFPHLTTRPPLCTGVLLHNQIQDSKTLSSVKWTSNSRPSVQKKWIKKWKALPLKFSVTRQFENVTLSVQLSLSP